jgi:predicted nucleic acid-binding protein
VRSLFDTNILVYADSADEPHKQRQAIALISAHRTAGTAVLCTQVLQEYANVALRKLQLPPALVRERLAFYSRFDCVATSADLIAGAIDLHVLHQLSFYDALVVQAAKAGGCQRVLTEDLQNGAVWSGVVVTNPFVAPTFVAPDKKPKRGALR